MANGPYGAPYGRPSSMPPTGWGPAYATEGVLSRRAFGYLVDLVMIALLIGLLSVLIAVLGVVTFGLGWALFGLLPFAGILYSAITLGGPHQATIGMRMMGIRAIDAATGGPIDRLIAAAHALLFYVAAGTFVLWLVDVFIGMARPDRRLGHDLLVGIMLVRTS